MERIIQIIKASLFFHTIFDTPNIEMGKVYYSKCQIICAIRTIQARYSFRYETSSPIVIQMTDLASFCVMYYDPLFQFHRWQANLRILEIKEIKSVPCTPESPPFIEHVVGSTRQEFLDHTRFWNERDLLKKLNQYKDYYNQTRGHWALDQLTPNQRADNQNKPVDVKILTNYC